MHHLTGWPVAVLIGTPVLIALALALWPRRDNTDQREEQQ